MPRVEGGLLAVMAREPRAATMAPLSVHKEGGGVRRSILAAAQRSVATWRNLEFAATPPAITRESIPESTQALIDFISKTSTTASWKDAATSARLKLGFAARYLETAVFKPENEKSKG